MALYIKIYPKYPTKDLADGNRGKTYWGGESKKHSFKNTTFSIFFFNLNIFIFKN